MFDELTKVDIKKMEEEIEYRRAELAPRLMAEMKRTREFGDLSENAEYKEAKREKRKNESRIRYLENMIRTANVIESEKRDNVVSLFDYVTVYNEKIGAEKRIQLVTTLRQNATLGYQPEVGIRSCTKRCKYALSRMAYLLHIKRKSYSLPSCRRAQACSLCE